MTRDEAIERIKARFDKWALDNEDMKAIQTLIPELTESKDEKIRKELIEFIQWSEDRGTTRHDFHQAKRPAEWIAYLEKQKEQKSGEDERIKKTIRQLLETARDAHSNTSLAKPFVDALAWLEKQKEQNGEDEECTDFTIYYPLKNGKGEYECIPYSFYDSLTFFSEDKDLIDFHRACFYTEEECNEWIEQHKEEEGYEAIPVESTLEYKLGFKAGKESEKQKEQKPVSISCGHENDAEWSEEDKEKIVTISEIIEHCTTIPYSGGTLTLNKEYKKELLCFIKSLRPQYHGDVTMTEAYKMGLEAGKASSWKPSEEQTNNVIVELTQVELGDIINGLYYLKEKYYEDCKEHNGTATVGLSDEFKFYFKRFNEVLDLYTRLHELEKEKYGTTTDGYYYE